MHIILVNFFIMIKEHKNPEQPSNDSDLPENKIENQRFIRCELARILPGGIIVGNGIREEYTGRLRLPKPEDFGDEYRCYILVDERGPRSMIVQRGAPKEDGFDFADISKHVADGCKVMTLEEAREAFPEDEE